MRVSKFLGHGRVATWPQIKFQSTLVVAAWLHSRKVLFCRKYIDNILIILNKGVIKNKGLRPCGNAAMR